MRSIRCGKNGKEEEEGIVNRAPFREVVCKNGSASGYICGIVSRQSMAADYREVRGIVLVIVGQS